MVVVPSAFSPAKSIADLTCALATGNLYFIPRSFEGNNVIGKTFSPIIFAPISRNGFIILSIGRRLSDSSPVNVALIPCPAIKPVSSLTVVPELPASKTFSGSLSPRSPQPFTKTREPTRSISTPAAAKQAIVERQSSPVKKFFISTVLSEMLANITAR